MHFNQHNIHDSIQILLNHSIIKEVECTKFLGIWFDSNLSWEYHIQHLSEKLSHLCYAFCVLSKVLPMKLKSVYFGYVHSILSYGITVWGLSSKSSKIFKLQERIIKIIKQVQIRTESKTIFREPVPCIYILESVSFIHQNRELFKMNSDFHEYNTRNSSNIHLNFHRLTRSLNSISHQGSNLYNHLPHNIKNFKIRKFKHAVKHILLTHMSISVKEYLDLKF